jgi:hypothetical protein
MDQCQQHRFTKDPITRTNKLRQKREIEYSHFWIENIC